MSLLLLLHPFGAPGTASIVGSGGFRVTGTATLRKTATQIGTSGLQLSGTAVIATGTSGLQHYAIVATSGVRLSGTAAIATGTSGLQHYAIVATSGIRLSGRATIARFPPSYASVADIQPSHTWILSIAGVERQPLYGWTVHMTANGRDRLTCSIQSADGTYRPALDQEITLTVEGEDLFGGFIDPPTESGIGNEGGVPIVTEVSAKDYNLLADLRYMNGVVETGTLKTALETTLQFLPGVTLYSAQPDGPSRLSVEYADIKIKEVLDNFMLSAGGWLWKINASKVLRSWEPGTLYAPFDITPGTMHAKLDVTSEPTRENYTNRVTVKTKTLRSLVAEDPAEITLRGAWELVMSAPDETPQVTLDELAVSILAQRLPILHRITYTTVTPGLRPGQTQVIIIPTRNLNNIFLITDVTVHGTESGVWYDVTAIEGLVFQPGWRETYEQWGNRLSIVGSISGGGGGGTGGVAQAIRMVYPLAGSGNQGAFSPVPTWVPATSMQVQINTVPRGTTSATIIARLWSVSAGVSVQARLFDVTANAACAGLSSVITSMTPVMVSWSVMLTAGSHIYELQLLPGVADETVLATGYLE